MCRAVCAALVLLAAAPAAAQAKRIAGRGRISVAPSVAYVPDTPLTQNGEHFLSARRVDRTPLGYGGWASFGYGATDGIEAAVDLLGAAQPFEFESIEPLTKVSFGAGVGARFIWQVDLGGFELQPRVAVGLLGTLLTVTGGGSTVSDSESFVTTYFGGVGTDLVLSESFGLQLEYRFLLGRARAPAEIHGSINAGGHFLMLGISYYLLGEAPHDRGSFDSL